MSVANKLPAKTSPSNKPVASCGVQSFFAKKEMPNKLLILDLELIPEFIQERRNQGTDRYDEVWEGVYIVPPLLVAALTVLLFNVILVEKRGQVFPGANVSDRRFGWKRKFRASEVLAAV